MKYINLKTVSISLVLIVLFSYQPPIAGNARTAQNIKLNIPVDTVRFKIDSLLLDSLLTLKVKFEVSKIETEAILDEISYQQQILKLQKKK